MHTLLPRHPRLFWRYWVHVAAGQRVELAVHLACVTTILAVTWVLAHLALPTLFPGWHASAYWLVAAWLAVADSLAGLLHELGHAAVALAHGGRVYRISLYGVVAEAHRAEGHDAHEQLLIALAGPASHLLLSAIFWGVWRLVPLDDIPLRVAVGLPAMTNLLVGVLNLLPFRSLDGGRALRALMVLAVVPR